jgi:hypothetical protein
MAKIGLTGNLKTMALPDLLQWTSLGKKTGSLVLRNESLSKKVFFKAGIIVGSATNDPAEYLGQILISESIITEQQLKDAIDQQLRSRVMLGRILVQQELVTEAKVAEILRRKAQETIYSLFLWSEAEFEFIEEELAPGQQVLVSIGVDEVLMEGLRRFDTSKQIRKVFPDNEVVLCRTRKALPREIAARNFPSRLYGLVDGRRTLADVILESHSPEFNVCQVLHAMVQRGYLSVRRPEDGPAGQRTGNTQAVVEIIAAARELIKMDDAEAALALLEKAGDAVRANAEVRALVQVAERYFVERAYRHYLPPGRIPRLKMPLEELVSQNLSPQEMFLASRVNGCWDLQSIMTISPLREVDALRALKKLREKGIIELLEPRARTA